jgi:hypothetical protein
MPRFALRNEGAEPTSAIGRQVKSPVPEEEW